MSTGASRPKYHAFTQTNQRCFPETGYCIAGRVREFWEQNGGLPVFGLPIGPQQQEVVEGKAIQVQWFERNRLELHPENARPYDVLLGRLGALRLAQQGRDWFLFPKSDPQAGCRYFESTHHNICGDFLTTWHAHGLDLDGRRGTSEAESLALFGLPLSDQMTETLSDGKQYTVQWFERVRFELHPENQPPYHVLIGLLGRELGSSAASPPLPTTAPPHTPTPKPSQAQPDPCPDVPDAVNGRIRPYKCVSKGTVIAMDIYGFQPNEQIGYWLNTPDHRVISTRQTYTVGPTGSGEALLYDTKDSSPGLWFWVFKSPKTEYQAIIFFRVEELPNAVSAPAEVPQPTTTPSPAPTPPPTNTNIPSPAAIVPSTSPPPSLGESLPAPIPATAIILSPGATVLSSVTSSPAATLLPTGSPPPTEPAKPTSSPHLSATETITPSLSASTQGVVRVDWPGRMDVDTSDTIYLTLSRSVGQTVVLTVTSDVGRREIASPISIPPPDPSVISRYGPAYEECVTAKLEATSFDAKPEGEQPCYLLSMSRDFEWSWNITPKNAGAQKLNISLNVRRTFKERAIESNVWNRALDIYIHEPWFKRGQIQIFSALSGFVSIIVALITPILHSLLNKKLPATERNRGNTTKKRPNR